MRYNSQPPAECPADEVVPLCRLRKGARGRVCRRHGCPQCQAYDVCPHCHGCGARDWELLRAMGLNENAELTVCRCGEPCIVKINSTRLGLSRAMTEHIFVSPLPESA